MSKYKANGLNISRGGNKSRLHILLSGGSTEKLEVLRTYLTAEVGKTPSKSLLFSLMINYFYTELLRQHSVEESVLQGLFNEVNNRPAAI